MKVLSKKQKKIELIRALKNSIKNDVEIQLIQQINNVVDSYNVPEEFYKEKNSSFLELVINERLHKIVKNAVKNIQL